MTTRTTDGPAILPPQALLLALLGQIPLLLTTAPAHPASWSIAAGAALIGAGIVMNVWAERLFRRSEVGVCPFTPAPVLVAEGPYRWTRNPMYLGLLAINAGATFMTGALANAWSSVALFVFLHYAFVIPEEQFLRRELGEEAARYLTMVPRWLGGSFVRDTLSIRRKR